MTGRRLFEVIWRGKWLFLLVALVVPTAAYLFSVQQAPKYEASAQVLLSYKDIAGALTGTDTSGSVFQDPERIAETQAQLARVPEVAQRVVAAYPEYGLTASEFLAASSVTSEADADLLVFRVTDGESTRAANLATEYGRQFTAYREQLDTAALTSAGKDIDARLKALAAAGQADGALYASLLDKRESLRTIEALQTSNAFLVKAAEGATKVSPKPVRNAIFGLAFGLILAIAFTVLLEALDTRLRSAEEISEITGLRLLGRLPAPPKSMQKASRTVMQFAPNSPEADSLRTLRTNIEFVDLDGVVKTILITSANEGDGKTTTAVNLAQAFVRNGRSVALIDLDLRRPKVARFFTDVVSESVDLSVHPGLTDVVIGNATLEEALLDTPVLSGGGTFLAARVEGRLDVLLAGSIPPNAGEIAGSTRVGEVIAALRSSHDVVIIDTPPVLPVSDAIAASRYADGIVAIVRVETARRAALKELARTLAGTPTRKLGFALAGSAGALGYQGYGYSSAPEGKPDRGGPAPGHRAEPSAAGGLEETPRGTPG